MEREGIQTTLQRGYGYSPTDYTRFLSGPANPPAGIDEMFRRLLGWLPGAGGDDRPDDPRARADRIREIGRRPLEHGHDATEEVVAALDDESPLVRATAAEVLGSVEVYHEVVTAEALIARLDDADRRVRLATAEALTITTDAGYVDDVYDRVFTEDVGTRAAAAVGLSHALARVTYEFTPAQIESLLEAVAASEPSPGTTDAADHHLARESLLAAITQGAADRDLAALDEDYTGIVVDALEHGPADVRRRAATLLGRVDRADVREPLADARERDPDERVREAAADALKRTDG